MNGIFNILGKRGAKSFLAPTKAFAAQTGHLIPSAGTGQLFAAETGQMPAVDEKGSNGSGMVARS